MDNNGVSSATLAFAIATLVVVVVVGVVFFLSLYRVESLVRLKEFGLGYLYDKFLNQEWPVVSSFHPSSLNVAYPDASIIYYVASFNNASGDVILDGIIPTAIYFWSITVYDAKGTVFRSWNDTLYPDKKYRIVLGVTAGTAPPGSYCVIQRVYTTSETPPLLPAFVPSIGLTGRVRPVAPAARLKNSAGLQSLLWKLFTQKFSSMDLSTTFGGVDLHTFFLPAKSLMSLVFPNPFAAYLMVFPAANNVIRVDGRLPPEIGFQNAEYRYLGFMASDFDTTSTNESVSFASLPASYTLYVAYSASFAATFGYDAARHRLLLWDASRTSPVLVFRVVSVSATPTGLFAMDNQKETRDGTAVSRVMGAYYPVATCF
ncbi:hypothetical protein EBZ80_02325 [bacterium]|nr:hypothetical protein [bacterium]